MASAEQLREQGNRAIKVGNYEEAERLYTAAIILSPKDHKLFTNRALARLRTHNYDGAALDAETASRISPGWMKAYRHAAVAYGELQRHDDAVTAALQAYTICLDTPGVHRVDLESNAQLVLAARRARWDFTERQRVRGYHPLMTECIDLIWKAQTEAEAEVDAKVERGEMEAKERDELVEESVDQARRKERELREVFGKSDPRLKERYVPDCFIDRISFNFMTDPVVTKDGHSYERAYLLDHLSHNQTDPLTGGKLRPEDLRPNFALREACEAFLKENEWAADF